MRMRTWAAGVMCLAVSAAAYGANDFEGRVVVTLDGALGQVRSDGQANPSDLKPLDVYATCHNGQWSDLWASAQDLNRNIHLGRILSGESAGGHIKLNIELAIEADNWVKGGPGQWALDLTRQGDKLEGTYSGQFQASTGSVLVATKKPATGYVLPPNVAAPDFVPPVAGEHPRLLFRKAELPRIKERLATPLGKVVLARLEKSDNPIALGMMYQLTGDAKYAQKAFPGVRAWMEDRSQGAFALGREWGYKTSRISMAYDLCYDGWNSAQREETQNYFDDILTMCLYRKHIVGTVNWQPGSNYTIVIHAGNGLAAMALAGEKTFPPAEPLMPRTAPLKLTAPAELKVGQDVPVVPLPVGAMPTQWLYAGPFMLHAASGEDPLASVGGVAKVRPEAGQTVQFRDLQVTWRPISRDSELERLKAWEAGQEKLPKEQRGKGRPPQAFMKGGQEGPVTYGVPKDADCLALPRLSPREHTRMFFYDVIEVTKAGWYQYQGHYWNAQCYLNGERVGDNEIVYLEAGKYPWMVPVVVGSPSGTARPYFVASSEEEATKVYSDPKRMSDYEAARKGYEAALAKWKQTGGVNQDWLKDLKVLEAWNYLGVQSSMGDGGFQGEGESYTLECHHVIHDYALAHRNFYGNDITGRPDVTHFGPRYVLTTAVLDEAGGKTRLFNQSYGRGEDTLPSRYLPRSLALAPKAWQPAMLWFWMKRAGVDLKLAGTEEGYRKLAESLQEIEPLVQMLVHMPLDLKPQNPGEVMPRAWQASGRAFYAFRNGWQGQDDIIAQIYGKGGHSSGWNQPEAGCFQIFGFGHELALKVNDAAGKTGSRWFDNVVMLPEDPFNAWGRAKVAYAKLDEKTGGGVVTFDMNPVYRGFKEVGEGKNKHKEETDIGITGLRSFGADFSKASGAAGLFAVVDKIDGGGKKQWVYQLPAAGRDGPDYKLTVEGNTFEIAFKDGAGIRGTFLAPPGVKISKAEGVLKAHPLSKAGDVATNALLASGADEKDGRFFVVLTANKGAQPAVSVAGQGLEATARIGSQTVRFDGRNVAIGK